MVGAAGLKHRRVRFVLRDGNGPASLNPYFFVQIVIWRIAGQARPDLPVGLKQHAHRAASPILSAAVDWAKRCSKHRAGPRNCTDEHGPSPPRRTVSQPIFRANARLRWRQAPGAVNFSSDRAIDCAFLIDCPLPGRPSPGMNLKNSLLWLFGSAAPTCGPREGSRAHYLDRLME